MGNRAVITTYRGLAGNDLGVYLHWNGGYDSVHAFLEYMKLRRYRSPDDDCYGWARLCQVIGNFFGGTLSVGVGVATHLDMDNWDNGVYVIQGWDIVGREYFKGAEQEHYSLQEMLESIDESQPEREQLGKEFLSAREIDTENLVVGDEVFVMSHDDKYHKYRVVGRGADEVRNGHNVNGVPYIDMYDHEGDYSWNVNNYLFEKSYRIVKPVEPDITGFNDIISN